MSVKIKALYMGDDTVELEHGPSGRKIVTDLPVDNGGKGRTFSPTDLLAAALSSCILTIMAKAAAKDHLDLKGATVEVEKDMQSSPVAWRVLWAASCCRRILPPRRRIGSRPTSRPARSAVACIRTSRSSSRSNRRTRLSGGPQGDSRAASLRTAWWRKHSTRWSLTMPTACMWE